MIDKGYIKELEKKLTLNDDPYPHIISKDFLPFDMVKQAEQEFIDFHKLENTGGYRYGNLKYHFDKFDKMPFTIQKIIIFDTFL